MRGRTCQQVVAGQIRSKEMGLFFGYVASLVATFALAASILGTVTSFIGLNTHPKVEYASQRKLSNKHVSRKDLDHRVVARGTKDKSVKADAAL
jgi:hypothetical protein